MLIPIASISLTIKSSYSHSKKRTEHSIGDYALFINNLLLSTVENMEWNCQLNRGKKPRHSFAILKIAIWTTTHFLYSPSPKKHLFLHNEHENNTHCDHIGMLLIGAGTGCG